MPGMNSGLEANDPVVVAAFRAALIHQGILALLIFGLVGAVWATARGRLAPSGGTPGRAAGQAAAWAAEPAGRRLLRIGFGLLWIFDGMLQAQPAMAAGLPSQVIGPEAASAPVWVQHVVNWGGTTWSYHPVQAAAAAVWIQVGIGIWLMAAADGPWSRLAGLAGAGWGLVVWVFGESFGGIFAPGLTWLSGAPGAVAFYCAAGVLIALPVRYWRTPRLGRAVLAVLGVFFAGMAVLQAWPGRGFWQGISHGKQGPLAEMTSSMAQTPQPGFLAASVRAFTSFDEAHGFAVNLFVVVALAFLGGTLLAARRMEAARPGLLRAAIVFLAVLCLANWVLVQDIGVFGGLGTDPNSMIPLLLLVIAGYLALAPAPATAPAQPGVPDQAVVPAQTTAQVQAVVPAKTTAPAQAVAPARPAGAVPAATAVGGGWRDRFRPAALRRAIGAASARSVVSAGAVGVILLGVAPMAAAQASRTADPILAESIAGPSGPLNYPAPPFRLTGQHGWPVSLASLRGKAVLLTFLDPACTTGCPVVQEFRAAGQLLGASSPDVALVAITLSPSYRSAAVIGAFTRRERLDTVATWLFLTGSSPQLQRVWRAYSVTAYGLSAGAAAGHTSRVYVIDRAGRVRRVLNTDAGPGTAATRASFASLLAGAARQALRSP
jgi:cytochrome oxidase Cu insertion factor (SCO1/SenC/PrrC family)